jgi:hypothetical protein
LNGCSTWECVNSFSNWISAIGTILISGIALWLSLRDRVTRIEVDLDWATFPTLNRDAYIINIVNVGARPATITTFTWTFRNIFLKKKRLLMDIYSDNDFNNICAKFPCEITFGKQAPIVIGTNRFITIPPPIFFEESKIKTWFKIRTLHAVVQTTVGKNFKSKVNKGFRRKIWSDYKDWRVNLLSDQ